MRNKTTDFPSLGRPGASLSANLSEQIEARSQDYLQRCWDTIPTIERHSIWTRLYTVSQRLSMALRDNGVADAVLEISSNLLACEEVAILQLQRDSKVVSFLASTGISATQRHALMSQFDRIAAEIGRGQVRIVDKRIQGDEFLDSIGVTALVPLSQGQATEGAIVFFKLLPQRKSYDSGDRELLGLLSVYVGPSLFGLK